MQSQTNTEDISLKELFIKLSHLLAFLQTKIRIILIYLILGSITGFTYAYLTKPRYIAECSFVLEEGEKSGGLGAYAGLASILGVDLGGGGGLFQEENIIRLYQSRSMLVKTLLSSAEFDSKRQLLINRYIKFNKLDQQWENDEDLQDVSFDIPTNRFGIKHDSLLTIIVEKLNKESLSIIKVDKKSSIINVSFKSKDEKFAKAFTEILVKNVNNFYVETKTNKSLQNIKILQHQADSIREMLNSAISGVARSSDANPNINPALQVLKVPVQKHSVDVQANTAILQELVKNLEIAKVTLRKETPLIQVIDNPILPLKKDKIGRIKGTLVGGLLFALLTIIFFLVQYFYVRVMAK